MSKTHHYFVYILANRKNGALYVGMTNSVLNRTFQHKLKDNSDSFTAKYNINKLVYFEHYQYVNDALQREKELKRYKRKWKVELIEKDNSGWRDLFVDFD